MIKRIKPPSSLFAMLLMLVFIIGCEQLRTTSQTTTSSSSDSMHKNYPQTINQIISLLENGQSNEALSELAKYLRSHPNSKSAQSLMQQLVEDPLDRYGKNFKRITVAKGGTFALYAKQYLGNAIEFYGLARYNNYRDPKSLSFGDKIKIPIAENKIKSKDKLSVQKTIGPTQLQKALSLFHSGNYLETIQLLLSKSFRSKSPKSNALILESFDKLLEQNSDLKSHNALNNSLTSLIERSPKNSSLRAIAKDKLNESYYNFNVKSAKESLDRNENRKAFDFLERAKLTNLPLGTDYFSVANIICNGWHRDAVLLFRKQELKRAIDIWDNIISINPSFTQAIQFRERAIKLQSQLQSIN